MTFFSVDLRTVLGVVRIPVGAYKSIAEMGRGVVVFWEAVILGLCKLLGPERGHRYPDMA